MSIEITLLFHNAKKIVKCKLLIFTFFSTQNTVCLKIVDDHL